MPTSPWENYLLCPKQCGQYIAFVSRNSPDPFPHPIACTSTPYYITQSPIQCSFYLPGRTCLVTMSTWVHSGLGEIVQITKVLNFSFMIHDWFTTWRMLATLLSVYTFKGTWGKGTHNCRLAKFKLRCHPGLNFEFRHHGYYLFCCVTACSNYLKVVDIRE